MRALILGVTGQDGYYLAEHLQVEGHEVWGVTRRPVRASRVKLIGGDLLDPDSLHRCLTAARPDVVYNLAAVTAPGGAWGTPQPPMLAEVTALGPVRLMDAMLQVCPDAALVHASSSAIYDPHRYGLYGIAKLFAHQAVQGYRGRLDCSNAVLFSHTSPRQDPRFLAPTICRKLKAGERLTLTDVQGRRDWGWAPDFVRALPLIAQGPPGDYDVATGQTHTVRDFVQHALDTLGADWGRVDLAQGPVAPAEHPADLGPLAALGWKPETPFGQAVRLMVEAA